MTSTSTIPQAALPLLLLTLVIGALSQSQSQPFALDYSASSYTRFCGTPCKNVSPIDRPLFLAFYQQPFYEVMSTPTSDSYNIDNICYTEFKLTSDSWILYISKVYTDGSNVVNTYVVSEATTRNYDGAWLTNSPNCTFTDYDFAEITDDIDAVYRCYQYGGCAEEGASSDYDHVFALSPTYQRADASTVQRAQEVFRSYGFGDVPLVAYAMALPSQCVTSQPCRNGVTNARGGCGCSD